MDALLISVMICSAFVLATLAERAAFLAMEWLLTGPLPDIIVEEGDASAEIAEVNTSPNAFARSSLTA
jgi:hypothetical protein